MKRYYDLIIDDGVVEAVSGVTGAALDLLFLSLDGVVVTAIGVAVCRFLRAANNPSA